MYEADVIIARYVSLKTFSYADVKYILAKRIPKRRARKRVIGQKAPSVVKPIY